MKLLAALAGLLLFFSPPEFACKWTGTLEDKVYVTLNLQEQNCVFSFKLRHPTQINTSPSGTLTGISGIFVEEPIGNVKLVGKELRFSTQDEDGEDIKYALRLTGTNTADLAYADPPKEYTVPKPWKLERGAPDKPQTELRRKR